MGMSLRKCGHELWTRKVVEGGVVRLRSASWRLGSWSELDPSVSGARWTLGALDARAPLPATCTGLESWPRQTRLPQFSSFPTTQARRPPRLKHTRSFRVAITPIGTVIPAHRDALLPALAFCLGSCKVCRAARCTAVLALWHRTRTPRLVRQTLLV